MNLSDGNAKIMILFLGLGLLALAPSLLTSKPHGDFELIDSTQNRSDRPLVIDLNRATYPELLSIDGIGPALAQRILSYRMIHGPVQSWEELDEIRGIGPVIIKEIRGSPGVCMGAGCNMR